MSNSFERAKAEQESEFKAAQTHNRKVLTVLAVFAGVALILCCAFSVFLTIRLT